MGKMFNPRQPRGTLRWYLGGPAWWAIIFSILVFVGGSEWSEPQEAIDASTGEHTFYIGESIGFDIDGIYRYTVYDYEYKGLKGDGGLYFERTETPGFGATTVTATHKNIIYGERKDFAFVVDRVNDDWSITGHFELMNEEKVTTIMKPLAKLYRFYGVK